MALLSVIRRWHYRDHLSIREIVRRTGLSRNTIRKYLWSDTIEPQFKVPERASKLDPFAERLSAWLQREMSRPRKQKRTIKQLHADLVSLGYGGSYNRVAITTLRCLSAPVRSGCANVRFRDRRPSPRTTNIGRSGEVRSLPANGRYSRGPSPTPKVANVPMSVTEFLAICPDDGFTQRAKRHIEGPKSGSLVLRLAHQTTYCAKTRKTPGKPGALVRSRCHPANRFSP